MMIEMADVLLGGIRDGQLKMDSLSITRAHQLLSKMDNGARYVPVCSALILSTYCILDDNRLIWHHYVSSSNSFEDLSNSLGTMKHGLRSTSFGPEILWRLSRISSPIPYLKKILFMRLRKDFVAVESVCIPKCIGVTGGGELRYVIPLLMLLVICDGISGCSNIFLGHVRNFCLKERLSSPLSSELMRLTSAFWAEYPAIHYISLLEIYLRRYDTLIASMPMFSWDIFHP